jgi:hypothetical protein
VAEVLPGGELVQAEPLDEIGFGVDDGDLEVVGVELASQIDPAERLRCIRPRGRRCGAS